MVLFLCKILLEVKMKGEMFNMNVEELNTQLEYLDETKSLIKQAIIDKGQSISEKFRGFPQRSQCKAASEAAQQSHSCWEGYPPDGSGF